MFEIKLINEVKKYPCIYHKLDAGYTNRIVRKRAWEAIAATLGVSSKQCKGRWRTLKDRFIKDNKVASGIATISEKPEWKFSEAMSFMENYVTPRPPSTSSHLNMKLEDKLQNQSFDPLSLEEPTSPTLELSNSANSITFDVFNSAPSSKPSKRKAVDNEERDKFLEIMDKLTTMVEKVVEKKETEEEEDSGYCKFLMSIVKKVDKAEQHRIKMELLNTANKMVQEVLNKKNKFI